MIEQSILKVHRNILILCYHKHEEKYSVLIQLYENVNPEINETFSIIDNCAKDCHDEFFHSFTFRCINKIGMTKDEFVSGMISDKELKNFVRKNGFIHKPTIKTDSMLSNILISYYLKFPLPIKHRQFFVNYLKIQNM